MIETHYRSESNSLFARRARERGAQSMRVNSGFTLIEVLVALLIFALGLIGAAGLQLSSLRFSQHSSQSVVATNLSREYAELMQVLPASVESTSAATRTSAFFVDSSTITPASTNPCVGSNKTCTTGQIVTAMRDDWIARVQSHLPGGRIEACRDSSPRDSNGKLNAWGSCDNTGSAVAIKIGWAAKAPPGLDGADTNQSWATSTDRPQFAVIVQGNLQDYKAN